MGIAEIRTADGSLILLDSADVERVQDFTWSVRRGVHGHAYASTKWKGKTILMHRYLVDPPPGGLVDHINNNGLDNRRCNLRVCTYSENLQNRKVHKNNQSGLKGAYPCGGRWKSSITVNGKKYDLGRFDTAQQAHEAYKAAATKLHGEFANPGDRPTFDTEKYAGPRARVIAQRKRGVASLSPQQREVIELIANGMMPAEVAAHLGLSANTVSTHLTRVKQRLEAKSTIHAAVIWARSTDAAISEYESWGNG